MSEENQVEQKEVKKVEGPRDYLRITIVKDGKAEKTAKILDDEEWAGYLNCKTTVEVEQHILQDDSRRRIIRLKNARAKIDAKINQGVEAEIKPSS